MTRSEAGKIGWLKSKAKREKRYKELREKYYKNPKRCKYCNEKIIFEKKDNDFCNHSCSASFNNLGTQRNIKTGKYANYKINEQLKIKKINKEPNKCLNCGIILETYRNKFCDNQCQQNYFWKEKKKEIEKNGEFPSTQRMLVGRRYLLEKYGHKCFICSNTEWMNKPIPLEFDHIDGNYKNNKIENCRLICGNCGMQLSTYKGANKGNGRYIRRMRYREGKSY